MLDFRPLVFLIGVAYELPDSEDPSSLSLPGSESMADGSASASRESPRVEELLTNGCAGSGWISPGSNALPPWLSCISSGIADLVAEDS